MCMFLLSYTFPSTQNEEAIVPLSKCNKRAKTMQCILSGTLFSSCKGAKSKRILANMTMNSRVSIILYLYDK